MKLSADSILVRLLGEHPTLDPIGAAARVVAIVVVLAAGLAIGHPLGAVLVAGGAYTVGFGAHLSLRGSPALVLGVASLGIGVSAIVGALLGGHAVTAALFASTLGAACGYGASRGAAVAWVALQCGLAGLIALSYAAPLGGAASRGALLVAGGLSQTALVSLIRLARHRALQPPADPFVPHYAVNLAVALAAAVTVERALSLRNGYWVPMTALLVLRPEGRHTLLRVAGRVAGTITGAALASAVIELSRPGPPSLVALVAAAAFGAYLLQKASYGVFAAVVTMYVVFILALAGVGDRGIAVERVLATILGGLVALAVQGISAVVDRARTGAAGRSA